MVRGKNNKKFPQDILEVRLNVLELGGSLTGDEDPFFMIFFFHSWILYSINTKNGRM